MIWNYLKIAFRNIGKHRGQTFINIVGLTTGMTCCLLIMIWVFDELSYDRFYKNAEQLYKIEQEYFFSGEKYHVYPTSYPMGPGFKAEIPEIAEQSRFVYLGNVLVSYKEIGYFENGVRAVDPSFLRMFCFPFIAGNPGLVLDDPNSLVISRKMAEKYFGSGSPLGEVIRVNNKHEFTVSGVFENVPSNSSLQFEMLLPLEFTRQVGRFDESWSNNSIATFVRLRENAPAAEVNKKMTQIRFNHVAESITNSEQLRRFKEDPLTQVMLIPITDVHLRRHTGTGIMSGIMTAITIFTGIAFAVLLIACINFMNLSTAKFTRRAKEVSMRKVVGAGRISLIGQFFSESVLQTVLALLLSVLITAAILPRFNVILGKDYSIHSVLQLNFIAGMVIITLITGIISGSYPALVLSSIRPVAVLKGALYGSRKGGIFRKILVLIQFSLSILLLISTGIVYKQLTYMQNMRLGYDKEHVIYIPLRGETAELHQIFKESLKNDPDVLNVSGSWQWPAFIGADAGGAQWEGKDPERNVRVCFNAVDFDYVETMKIELAEGRSFSRKFMTDTSYAFLINEALLRIMGKPSGENERFRFQGIEGRIVGVMKDFNFKTLHTEIEPLAIIVNPSFIDYSLIRLASGDISAGIKTVQSAWEKCFPRFPFEYRFLDESLEYNYQNERIMRSLIQVFSILAILIACLGLYGLASFNAEQRTKEIGVRKVLGASVPGVVFLLAREFTKCVLIANVIAWPVAYFGMNRWLENFAYRADLNIWIFMLSGVAVLAVALLTISYQTVKSASANPVNSLRYE